MSKKILNEICEISEHVKQYTPQKYTQKFNLTKIKTDFLNDIENLYNYITTNWVEKTRKSAFSGRNYCYVYFINKEEDKELLTNRGIYEKLNVHPSLYYRLKTYFEKQGFMFSVKDDTKLNKKVVCISWNLEKKVSSHPQQRKTKQNKKYNEEIEEIKTETIKTETTE